MHDTVVHSLMFTGHLVYVCVVVALIFRNDNSLIVRRELTKKLKNPWVYYRNIWENIIATLFIEYLATEIVESYKHLAGIREE